jgi:quinol monooxygenase YgiN
MIHVIALIELVPGTRAAFLAEFHKIVGPVRAEQGCLEYGPAIDAATGIPQQKPLGEDVVTVVEKWASVAALQAHLAAPHMLTYRERVKSCVRGVRLHILEPA